MTEIYMPKLINSLNKTKNLLNKRFGVCLFKLQEDLKLYIS
jgi:hypothetical protein